MFDQRALIIGGTGIVGNNLARHLVSQGDWDVSGLSRHAPRGLSAVRPVNVDVLDAGATRQALAELDPTHVFFCAWTRRPTEKENCEVNGAMVRNVLEAVTAKPNALRHVGLVTGTKHYLGPFESYGQNKPDTPFREDQPRLPLENFYYNQEDLVFEFAARFGFSWTVYRPHTIIGYAVGNAMNLGVTLATYASICKATGRPFLFPGSPTQYYGLADVTDARLLARHIAWASTSPSARNEAFNVVNGDVFRWQRMWNVIARYFEVEPAPYSGEAQPLEQQLADAGPIWDRIVAEHKLQPIPFDRLASPWHTDADLGRPIECVNDVSKSRRLGFTGYQSTERSFLDLFDQLRHERLIP